MCRKQSSCHFVEPNDKTVPAPLTRPQYFDEYFTEFATNVKAALEGTTGVEAPLLARNKERELNAWFTEHAQMAATFRKNVVKHRVPDGAVPDLTSLKQSCIRAVNKRDNYMCRYCGHPVLPAAFFTKLTKSLGSDRFRSVGTNVERHGIKLVFSATADHLVPRADGGVTDSSNLVTACWPCNYGKANFTIQELGMTNPLERHPLSLDARVAELMVRSGQVVDALV
jgi:hypothetical protein